MTPEQLPELFQELALLRTALGEFSKLILVVFLAITAFQFVSWYVTIWAEKKRSRNGSLERDLLASRRARIDRQRMGQELRDMIREGEPKIKV